jgi:hypothetical protein
MRGGGASRTGAGCVTTMADSEIKKTEPAESEAAGPAEFKLERYKYILNEIHFLNENIHKYLSLFQTLATAVAGGAAAIFVGWRKFDSRLPPPQLLFVSCLHCS